MLNNIHNSIITRGRESCQNETMCKFSDDFQELIDKVENIEFDFASPFSVDIKTS